MGEQSKATVISILVNEQPYQNGAELQDEDAIVLIYTRRGDDGRMRHISLSGKVEHELDVVGRVEHSRVMFDSATDTDTGKLYRYSEYEAVLNTRDLEDKVHLADKIVSHKIDLNLDNDYVKWSDIDFPSDHLSVKRLRTMFPKRFDRGQVDTGFGDYFFPSSERHAPQLVDLNNLVNYERCVTDYAFRTTLAPELAKDEDFQYFYPIARDGLQELYQRFKLADSPETAEFLIRQLEDEGVRQAKQISSPSR